MGGKTTGQEGALQTILLAPLGRGLLGLVALGLLGYATWRLFQGIVDPDDEGGDAKGLINAPTTWSTACSTRPWR